MKVDLRRFSVPYGQQFTRDYIGQRFPARFGCRVYAITGRRKICQWLYGEGRSRIYAYTWPLQYHRQFPLFYLN